MLQLKLKRQMFFRALSLFSMYKIEYLRVQRYVCFQLEMEKSKDEHTFCLMSFLPRR